MGHDSDLVMPLSEVLRVASRACAIKTCVGSPFADCFPLCDVLARYRRLPTPGAAPHQTSPSHTPVIEPLPCSTDATDTAAARGSPIGSAHAPLTRILADRSYLAAHMDLVQAALWDSTLCRRLPHTTPSPAVRTKVACHWKCLRSASRSTSETSSYRTQDVDIDVVRTHS